MLPVLTPDEMAAVDAAAPEPIETLIDRAGRAVARVALDMLGGSYGRVVRVIAGKGNNGADGRVAAEMLRRRGVQVEVIDAATAPTTIRAADLVIDAAYGTGFRGAWQAPSVGSAMVLAVDVPSGVDALTGGAGEGVLPADRTITFQALKPGLVSGAGAKLAGRVEVVDIGLDVSRASCHLVDRDDVASWWPRRALGAHKWQGAVRVVAGSEGMSGAGVLCAHAAARAGASLVTASAIGTALGCRPEVMQRELDPTTDWSTAVFDDLDRFGALAIGPGLGRDERTVDSTRRCIEGADLPVVVDGDGLFALVGGGATLALGGRSAATILTPHDGEFRQLTGSLPDDDRVAATRRLAADLGCTVLLKGPTTVIADPGGAVFLVDHGDQRLATAGSGDVLTGIIGALLAASVEPLRAAAAAAWIHAEAGRRLQPCGLLAGDLVAALPGALADLLATAAAP